MTLQGDMYSICNIELPILILLAEPAMLNVTKPPLHARIAHLQVDRAKATMYKDYLFPLEMAEEGSRNIATQEICL